MRCIVVEDEPLALERMVEYAGRLPLLDVVGTFDNATDALACVARTPVDLVFLDINLGGWSGVDWLETRTLAAHVVLTTAHAQHAARAYDLDVVDYLVKPFTFERFVQAVDRVHAADSRAAAPPPDRTSMFVKTEQRLERVAFADLLVIEGQRDYRRIHTPGKRIMTLQTFSELEQAIPRSVACRVHKSFMVALDKIDTIERGRINVRGMSIPLSDTYRTQFFAAIEPGKGRVRLSLAGDKELRKLGGPRVL